MYEVKNAKNTFVWTSDLQDGYKSQRLDQLIKNYFHQIKNYQKWPRHRNVSSEKVFSFLANFGQLRFQTLRSSRQQLRDDKRLFFQSASLCWDNYPQQSSLYHHLPYGHNWRTQRGRSLTTLTQFCPLLTTYLPPIDIREEIYLLL